MQASSVPEPTAPIGPPLDAGSAIAADIYCRQCGYNLRGLTEAHRCPECGVAVGLSTRGDLLRFAEPGWVERIARGGRLVMGGLTAIVVGIIALVCAGMLAAPLLATSTNPALLALPVIAGIGILAAFAAVAFGVWLITARDPADTSPTRSRSARILARTGVISAILAAGLDVLGDVAVTTPVVETILALALVATTLVMFVGALAYLRYCGKLADRIPEPKLVARARNLFRSLILLFAIMLVPIVLTMIVTTRLAPPGPAAGPPVAPQRTTPGVVSTTISTPAVPPAAPGPRSTTLMTAMSVSVCAAMVFWLVLFFVYVRWQSRLGKALREQAAFARATWAATSARQGSPPPR